MNKALVYYNDIVAGVLERTSAGFRFTYNEDYISNDSLPSISLTLPKTQSVYLSKVLFPFFYGLLAEGVNKEVQCRTLKIDESDFFTRLIKTAERDTIGAITIKEII